MVVEIAGDDAVLQHAAERQAVAARRPGDGFADDIIRAEQHDGAEHQCGRHGREPRARHELGIEPGQQQRRGAEPKQHRKGGAMGRARKRNEHHQRVALAPRHAIAVPHQRVQRQHGETGKNVGREHARQPRQRRRQCQHRRDRRQRDRMGREAIDPQQQADDPGRRQGLQDNVRPEVERPAGSEEEPIGRRAARHQIALEPARQIAAGVVFQKRKAVPQRRRQQNERRRNRRDRPRNQAW